MKFTRVIKYTVSIIAIVLLANIATILIVSQWHRHIPKADAVIVLGAAINTPALYNRTLKGLELYEAGLATTMVLSGGKIADSDISEAEYMEKVIQSRANKSVHYILEDQSHSTFDNIINSKQKLGDAGSVIIVSDEFHLARAVLMAKRAGFKDVYWAAPEPKYYSDKQLRFYYIREFVAMLSYIPALIFLR